MKKKKRNKVEDKQRGVIIFLAVVIMAILLSIGLALTAILMGEIRIIRGIGHSVIAFYAADTGIERMLLCKEDPIPCSPISNILTNNSEYEVEAFNDASPDCNADNYCLHSFGTFRGVTRAIEVEY